MNLPRPQRRVLQPLLFLTACWLISIVSVASAADALVWKFAVGDIYNYQMIQEMEMSMNLGPTGKTESSLKQTMDMSWKVESIDENGAATVSQHISRVQMDITAPGQDTVHYDTTSDEKPQGYAAMLAPMFAALTSEKFTLTMAPSGEISNVEVPESIVEAMSRGPGAAMMGGLASEEGLQNMAKQGALALPNAEDLVEGYQWSTSLELANPATGKITIDTTYQYAGSREIEGQQFEVFVPSIKTSFGGEEGGAQIIKVAKQETTGEILFNRSAGRLESSTINQHMETVITSVGNEINQVLDQKVTFKIIESADATQ